VLTEEQRKAKNAWTREYRKRPDVKAKRRAYYIMWRKRPAVRLRIKLNRDKPENRAKLAEYARKPRNRQKRLEYRIKNRDNINSALRERYAIRQDLKQKRIRNQVQEAIETFQPDNKPDRCTCGGSFVYTKTRTDFRCNSCNNRPTCRLCGADITSGFAFRVCSDCRGSYQKPFMLSAKI
jgi:hypothetical protein